MLWEVVGRKYLWSRFPSRAWQTRRATDALQHQSPDKCTGEVHHSGKNRITSSGNKQLRLCGNKSACGMEMCHTAPIHLKAPTLSPWKPHSPGTPGKPTSPWENAEQHEEAEPIDESIDLRGSGRRKSCVRASSNLWNSWVSHTQSCDLSPLVPL